MQYRINQKRVVEPVIRYRCPDCGQQAEIPAAPSDSADCDIYQSVLCPRCQQLHSVNPTSGQVVGEDELGDPW
jgi:DNA-directed RNA polymerase subunit RPC12/RpoP